MREKRTILVPDQASEGSLWSINDHLTAMLGAKRAFLHRSLPIFKEALINSTVTACAALCVARNARIYLNMLRFLRWQAFHRARRRCTLLATASQAVVSCKTIKLLACHFYSLYSFGRLVY